MLLLDPIICSSEDYFSNILSTWIDGVEFFRKGNELFLLNLYVAFLFIILSSSDFFYIFYLFSSAYALIMGLLMSSFLIRTLLSALNYAKLPSDYWKWTLIKIIGHKTDLPLIHVKTNLYYIVNLVNNRLNLYYSDRLH